ncbi:MAG: glycosyltransferase, partial [Turicibacter sp.]
QYDYIISISDEVTKSFLSQYPSLESKIVMIENITSPQFIRMMANENDQIPFHSEHFNIVSVGRLCYPKGYDNAVKALRILHDRGYTNLKWYIVGYGGDEPMLRELIAQNGLEDSFILLGKKINPYPYIKACDLYVQPSRYEGKAVTVTEAQILYKPVLITNYETAHSQLKNEFDGYITEKSIEGIADGVEKLYLDAQLREQLVEGCKQSSYGNADELQKLYSLF